MIIVGVRDGLVEICVVITDDHLPTVREMYPDHVFSERIGNESIGWSYDGVTFYPPSE